MPLVGKSLSVLGFHPQRYSVLGASTTRSGARCVRNLERPLLSIGLGCMYIDLGWNEANDPEGTK